MPQLLRSILSFLPAGMCSPFHVIWQKSNESLITQKKSVLLFYIHILIFHDKSEIIHVLEITENQIPGFILHVIETYCSVRSYKLNIFVHLGRRKSNILMQYVAFLLMEMILLNYIWDIFVCLYFFNFGICETCQNKFLIHTEEIIPRKYPKLP